MTAQKERSNRKKYGADLLIIGLTMLLFYGLLGLVFMAPAFDMEKLPLLARTLLGAVIEYGVLGFGVTLVCLVRKESFRSFGLKKEKLAATLLLSALVCVPSLLHQILTGDIEAYLPFQGVSFTRPVLAAGFPANVFGMLLIYGMLVVYQYTGNAWGCVFIYCFYWNAM